MKNKKIIEAIKYWSQVFLLPVYWLSFLIPRNKKIWVFGSSFGKRFADNPKYFYLYMNQIKTNEVRSIWISKNIDVVKLLNDYGLESYSIYSIKGIWFSLRAKAFIYDNYSKDICFWLSGGSVKINLWHGIPLKKINMDNKFDLVRNPRSKFDRLKYFLRRLSDEKPSHYVLTTSKFLVPIFMSAFATNRVLCCGYPRNDILTGSILKNVLTHNEKEILDKITSRKRTIHNSKVVIYMPTFRDSEAEFFEKLDQRNFMDFLKMHKIILCIKPHPKSTVKKKYLEMVNNNIIMIDADADPYVYFSCTDVLITDYSSIYFDYLLLDKPIIFFCHDLNKYLSCSREMYFDYQEFTPGVKAKTLEELKDSLSNLDNLIADNRMKNKRKIMIEKLFIDYNKNASEKLYNYILNYIL